SRGRHVPGRSALLAWGGLLLSIPSLMAVGIGEPWNPSLVLIAGLALFGAVFAINSSLHSFLIVSYARAEGASLDVGVYYMANAAGRLLGTLLSGWVYQLYGLGACLWVSALLLLLAVVISIALPRHTFLPSA